MAGFEVSTYGRIWVSTEVSREVARRELAGLVRLGLLRLIGRGRGARYLPLSFWLSLMSDVVDVVEWAMALV